MLVYYVQFGLLVVLLILGNVYGFFDNFLVDGGYVVLGMIWWFYDVVLSLVSFVICWGSGNLMCDFFYVGDLVVCLLFLID